MTELLSAAQIGVMLGLNPTAARQALWRAGYREQRGYLPSDALEFAAQRGVALTPEQIGPVVCAADGSGGSITHSASCECCDGSGFIRTPDDEDNCPCILHPEDACAPCRLATEWE